MVVIVILDDINFCWLWKQENELLLSKPCLHPQKHFKDCVFDLCELDGTKSILCEAIEAYVNECQDRGVTIGPWRNETFCRKY